MRDDRNSTRSGSGCSSPLLTCWLTSCICILSILLLSNDAKLRSLEEQIQNIIVEKDNSISNSKTILHRVSETASIASKQQRSQSKGQNRQRILTVKGVAGDGVTDDTAAINKALRRAGRHRLNAKVVLRKGTYLITSPLLLPGGVTLSGQGYGSSPLAIQFDAGGTVIAYCGTDYAVRITGHGASIENLAVYDWPYPQGSECETMKAQGGILIHANNRLIESVVMNNLLIYWFMGGTALTLQSSNQGGVAFCHMENIRVRHAKIGIHLYAMDELSFVNSNSFTDGAVTGGITDMGVWAAGPGACNDNQFRGVAIEPPDTNVAHVYIEGPKTNVVLDGVRLEGTEMAQDKPMVIVEDSSYGNIMNGILGHTFVKADMNRNPGITFSTNKMTGIQPAPANLFWNAAFHGFNVDDQSVPGWTFDGSSSSSSSDFTVALVPASEEALRYPDHNIISFMKTSGSTSTALKFTQTSIPTSAAHSFCTFGIYAKSSTPNSIVAVMKYESGSTISSSAHTGSGNWEFISMSALFAQSTGPLSYFSITGDVYLTAPVFSYGKGPPVPGSEFLSSAGARMSGILTMNVVTVSPPESGGFWTLPKEGNIFDILPLPSASDGDGTCSTSYRYISRISHSTADRFYPGAIITLLFPECGSIPDKGCIPCLGITHGSYIKLVGNTGFAPPPTAPSSSLTLLSMEFGVWKEISRNTI